MDQQAVESTLKYLKSVLIANGCSTDVAEAAVKEAESLIVNYTKDTLGTPSMKEVLQGLDRVRIVH
jgi:hypothetical protein